MKVTICQLNIEYENKEENLFASEHFISEASASRSDIIFFPEMTYTGFSMNTSYTGEINFETVEAVKKLAEKYSIAIGFGWVKLVENKAENHYTVVSSDKEILVDYVKLHPFSYSGEDKFFNAGDSIRYFEFEGKTIGIFICYDLRFPEIFQAVSKKAEIIIVAANWPERRAAQWKILLDARAVENQSWILGVNCFGKQDNTTYSGNSRIVKPDGELYDKLDDAEGCISCDISDEAQNFRENFPVKQDRRIEFYRSIL